MQFHNGWVQHEGFGGTRFARNVGEDIFEIATVAWNKTTNEYVALIGRAEVPGIAAADLFNRLDAACIAVLNPEDDRYDDCVREIGSFGKLEDAQACVGSWLGTHS